MVTPPVVTGGPLFLTPAPANETTLASPANSAVALSDTAPASAASLALTGSSNTTALMLLALMAIMAGALLVTLSTRAASKNTSGR